MPHPSARILFTKVMSLAFAAIFSAASTLGGPLPGPLPLFPSDNWWNLDISSAPVDSASASYIAFIGPARGLHPDFGGDVSPGSVGIYGYPYAVVDSSVLLKTVRFQYSDESDGVNQGKPKHFGIYAPGCSESSARCSATG